jgi:hypothetical protein
MGDANGALAPGGAGDAMDEFSGSVITLHVLPVKLRGLLLLRASCFAATSGWIGIRGAFNERGAMAHLRWGLGIA